MTSQEKAPGRPAWRLLNTGSADGPTNMAVDEAIMESVGEGTALPTLRFYGWRPPCVSIGYAQRLEKEINLERCQADGIQWVRRPTGGRAILHTDELTYSLALTADDPRVRGGVMESYRRLSQGLLAGLQILGLDVIQATEQPTVAAGSINSAACFDRPSHYEITCQGQKLVGSAQVRRRNAVLQHGSLPLSGDVTRLVQYLRLPTKGMDRLRSHLKGRAITLSEAMGHQPDWDELTRALAAGFGQALGVEIVPGSLSSEEEARVQQLRSERYASPDWNRRR
jgi:lipoate-protein ligase A